MKWFTRYKGKWLLALCNLIMACVLIIFSGCFAGADYEDKMIYTYRSKGALVFDDFKATRSNQASSQPQVSETADEILYRIIDTETKRSGQLVYASIGTTIHAQASKLRKLFPDLRIAVVHKPFSEWPRSWVDAGFRYEGRKGLQVEYLDENCCPEEYKVMKKEDFDKIVSDFFCRSIRYPSLQR